MKERATNRIALATAMLLVLGGPLTVPTVAQQRVRIPAGGYAPGWEPGSPLAPVNPPAMGTPPSASFAQAPPFDAYSPGYGGAAATPPMLGAPNLGVPPPATSVPGLPSTQIPGAPLGAPGYGAYGSPYGVSPYDTPYPASPYGASPYGVSPYGVSPYGVSPYGTSAPVPGAPYTSPYSGPAAFPPPQYQPYPNGLFGSPSGADFASSGGNFSFGQWFSEQPVRFLQGPRVQHMWMYGNGSNDIDINDTDISIVATWPNFLYSNMPLYIAPSFSLHLWSGPELPSVPVTAMPDLPSQAFSGFIDVGWESHPNATFGAELGTRLGVFADFRDVESDSFRILGKGLLRVRLTPKVVARGGVFYLDRVRLQFLPAGGFLWTPNPQTRVDFFFPRPKLSKYFSTAGNTDIWWYVAAEYGGGSWTIKRDAGNTEQMDINDIRVFTGFEWGPSELFRRGRRMAFVEAGWVTERELLYADTPKDNIDLNDTFFVRGGLGY